MISRNWFVLVLLSMSLIGCTNRTDANNPKIPYDSWYLQGIYPHYMDIDIQYIIIITQDHKLYETRLPLTESTTSTGKWSNYPGGVAGKNMYMDLPKQIGICWLSYLDKKTYWAEFEIPLSARQMMVEPIPYYSIVMKEQQILYRDTLWIGAAPDASVTVWLGGVPLPRESFKAPIIVKTQGEEMIDHPNCNSGYDDPNDIPDISDEGKAWIKANGLPATW